MLALQPHVLCGWMVAAGAVALVRTTALAAPVEDELRVHVELASVWALATATWVVLFAHVVKLEALEQVPLLWVALLWPIVLFTGDLLFVDHQTLNNEGARAKNALLFEMNGVSSIAFALGGLLASNLGKTFSQAASPILASALLICLCFVFPRPAVHSNSLAAIVIASVQRVCLVMCSGLLISAVLLSVQGARGGDWMTELRRALSGATPAD